MRVPRTTVEPLAYESSLLDELGDAEVDGDLEPRGTDSSSAR